jgi:transcriptional regulator with PAS, ATPase and Fis domain
VFQTFNIFKKCVLIIFFLSFKGEKIVGNIITIYNTRDIKKIVRTMMGYDHNNIQFSGIIGKSQVFDITKHRAEVAAKSRSTILIRGESGTGKELFARSIHNCSPMHNGPFIAINCAAIPETLLESEFFGYDGGAFTGAKKEGKPGKFELADGGTLFLDEIGDMPLYLQAKLLRVLQERRIQRVGGLKDIKVNVRIIAATNKDLEKIVSENRFREDLFYRLNVIPIFIPPLSERREDIPILIEHFINKYNLFLNKNIESIDEVAEKIFMSYSWPGNVRELENALEYAMNMENGKVVMASSLPGHLANEILLTYKEQTSLEDRINNYEKTILLEEIKKYGVSLQAKKMVAEDLQIGIATLYRKLKSHNIDFDYHLR